MKKIILIPLLLALSACANTPLNSANAQTRFFDSLSSLCGQRFEGVMTYPTEGQDSFAGKILVAKFASCNNAQIKIPFAVGEDHSRTWIISLLENSLELKHDHRHEDGSPDDVNLYGGKTNQSGTPLKQSFLADKHTANIIPAASTNVWTMSFNDDKTELTYHLERHQQPRFTAVLKRITQ